MLARQETSCMFSHSRETWVSSNWFGLFWSISRNSKVLFLSEILSKIKADFRCGSHAKQQIHIKFHISRKFEEKIWGHSVNTVRTDYLSKLRQTKKQADKQTEIEWGYSGAAYAKLEKHRR